MDIRQLRGFLAAAELGSFAKAGKDLFVTSSAISYQISSLESSLSLRLFHREAHAVKLTRAGEYFYHEVQSLMQCYKGIVEKAHQVETGHTGSVSIGFLGNLERRFLPLFSRRFQQEYPCITLDIEHYTLRSLEEALSEGRIDVAFTLDFTVGPGQGFRNVPLHPVPMMVVVRNDHPLADHDSISLPELDGSVLLCMAHETSEASMALLKKRWSAKGFTPSAVRMAANLETLLLQVEAGLGITCHPKFRLDPHRNPGLRCITLSDESLNPWVVIAWRELNDNPCIPLVLGSFGIRF